MGCGWYKLPDGSTVHINFGRNKAPKRCVHCGGFASKLCDHKVAVDQLGRGPTTAVTCDASICDACAFTVPGKNRDYCKHHAKYHRAEVPAPLPFGE
jgi:hypothetical protein